MLVAHGGRTHRQVSPRRAGQPRRVYVGRAVTRRASTAFFLRRTTQHVTVHPRLADWLGALAMLCGIVSWGALLALLGS